MWGYLLGAAAISLTGLLVLRRLFVVIAVDGDSMWPALYPGDRVLVRRTGARRLRRDQVVVVAQPGEDGRWTSASLGSVGDGKWIIKRVAAIPGDPVPEVCASAVAGPPGGTVPTGKLVLLGDNAGSSHDSRQLGYIPAERLLGVVLHRIAHQPDVARRPFSGPAGRR